MIALASGLRVYLACGVTDMRKGMRVTRRPRYACRACEGCVVVAEAPARPICDESNMPISTA